MASKIQAIAALAATTNVDLWNLARQYSANFKSHTSEGTADMFTERGFEALKATDINQINEFFNISMRVGLQLIQVSKAKNPFADKGLIEYYDTPDGAYTQRIAIDSLKPVSPKFKGLKDGDTVDPYVVRKPNATERFFGQNYDYQSWVTLQDFQVKTIMTSTTGMGSFVAGVMEALQNGYTVQDYVNTMEVINTAINSSKAPLKDSQVITNTVADVNNPTDEELTTFILSVQDLLSAMTIVPQTAAYNAGGFNSTVDKSDLVMLIKPSVLNRIKVNLITGAFNPETLSLGIDDVIPVMDFGGLQPYKESGYTTPLYPVYDKAGTMIGYNEADGQDTVTVKTEEAFLKDPNADVMAVIMQKGAIFETRQNPYSVQPIYNPRGLYTNYWASSPNTGINYDSFYNVVVFKGEAGE